MNQNQAFQVISNEELMFIEGGSNFFTKVVSTLKVINNSPVGGALKILGAASYAYDAYKGFRDGYNGN